MLTELRVEISKTLAHQLVLEHKCCWFCFLSEMGDKPFYQRDRVLDWLGY